MKEMIMSEVKLTGSFKLKKLDKILAKGDKQMAKMFCRAVVSGLQVVEREKKPSKPKEVKKDQKNKSNKKNKKK